MFSKENYTGKTIMYVLITDKYTLKNKYQGISLFVGIGEKTR